MKKEARFIMSLEKYTWKVVGRTPLRQYWWAVGVIIVVSGIIASVGLRGGAAGARSERELMLNAAKVGDYTTARTLWESEQKRDNSQVLGAESEIEELVYPERKVEAEIRRYEKMLETYPNNRDLLLHLSTLGKEIGDTKRASEYREQARILDPNNEIFAEK